MTEVSAAARGLFALVLFGDLAAGMLVLKLRVQDQVAVTPIIITAQSEQDDAEAVAVVTVVPGEGLRLGRREWPTPRPLDDGARTLASEGVEAVAIVVSDDVTVGAMRQVQDAIEHGGVRVLGYGTKETRR